MSNTTLLLGDCLTVMATLEANSIDAIVTDPPAGISFMSAKWDGDKGGRRQWIAWMTDIAAESLRLLKPGGHALVWALPRTSHWTATAWEDAGFELRDCVYHLFGSGFPKSLDVGKAIDKMSPRMDMFAAFAAHFAEQRKASGLSQKSTATHFPSKTGGMTGCVWNWENGANVPTREQWEVLQPLLNLSHEWLPLIERVEAEREVVGMKRSGIADGPFGSPDEQAKHIPVTAPATDAARTWAGFGTALKPSVECWWLLRAPLSEPTISQNVLRWGTGAINVDACRIGMDEAEFTRLKEWSSKYNNSPYQSGTIYGGGEGLNASGVNCVPPHAQGRWPANLVLSDDAAALLDQQSGERKGSPAQWKRGKSPKFNGNAYNNGEVYRGEEAMTGYGDTGGASRFFLRVAPDADAEPLRMGYYPKASKRDRDEGLEGMPERLTGHKGNLVCLVCGRQKFSGSPCECTEPQYENKPLSPRANHHPTVKPTALMRWLVRLVTPPGGVVLDPFAGSGSTLKAAILEGFDCVGIELDPEYLAIAQARCAHAASAKADIEAQAQLPLLEAI